MRRTALAATIVALLAGAPSAHALGQVYIGNDDYATIWTTTETQTLDRDKFPTDKAWAKSVCQLIRKFPAAVAVRGACTANYALKAISKFQLDWFFYQARLNGSCAVAIFDYGHHPIKKKWKVRSAQDYEYRTALPRITFGDTDPIVRSDTDEYPTYLTCNA